MNAQPQLESQDAVSIEIRVRGRVQGVGFRPPYGASRERCIWAGKC